MSVQLESTERFFRPTDVENIRRNYRVVRLRSLVRGLRSVVLVLAAIAIVIAAVRHTQSDARFAIQRVEVAGAVHTSRAALEKFTKGYRGLNLFKLDIDRVRGELGSLAWVSRIEIEKALPDTLRIRIVERTPVALVAQGGGLRYVDENGAAFADLTPAVGDQDLPVIAATTAAEIARGVELVRRLREHDPAIYARVSEVRPLLPHGYAIFDRQLGATILAEDADLSSKWRDLYSIVAAERLQRGDVEYADLRFNDRIVVKPLHMILGSPAMRPETPTVITN